MSNMVYENQSYKIQFEDRKLYLFAYVAGETDSLEVSLQFWADILKETKELNHRKVLVVENFGNSISTFDTYILNQRLGQMGFFNIRIAFVDEVPGHEESNLFGETVATNRGLIVKVFSDTGEAEKWLLEH